MKNIKILLSGMLTIFLISCGNNNSNTTNITKIDGFWQDLDENKLTLFSNNSMYTYRYYKDKIHGASGDCYSRYKRADIESNATEPTILNYLYYSDRFLYSGPINIDLKENELKFLRKYGDEYNQKNEVVKQYEKVNLTESDIDMCNFADRPGGITEINKMEGLWKLSNSFKFEPSTKNVKYWLISNDATVTSLIYNNQSECYIGISDYNPKQSNYYFIHNIYHDGRLNLIYNADTSPGHAYLRIVLASLEDNVLTLFGFDNNDVSKATKEDMGSIKICN